jgi:putative transposase
MFRNWFGVSRFVYNEAINNLNLPKDDECRLKGGKLKFSTQLLQQLPELSKRSDAKTWLAEVPFQIKKIAARDAFNAFKTGCSKYKNTGESFKLKHRSRKNPKQSCFIPETALRCGGIYSKRSGNVKMSESLPHNFRDSRLVLDNDRWFLHVPYQVKITTSDKQGRVVALDPGIRTFLTGFSPDSVFKVGSGDFSRIARLAHHCDDLISRMTKVNRSKRFRMKKALHRMKHKIWNLIDELHFKSINFLMKSFDCVVFPTFNSSEMVTKATRKIRSKTVRAMLTFAFFRFSQRLEHKAKTLGKTVIRISEAYTSKTASWTGEIKEKLGSAKFISSNGDKMDRDINGARGIFLRALGDNPSIAELSMLQHRC